MNKLLKISLVAIIAITFAGCGGPAANTTNATNANANTTNANAVKPTSEGPSTETLMAVENKAWEAWKNKDAKFFEDFLTANYVGFGAKGRSDKAGMMKDMAAMKCEAKTYSLSDGKVHSVSSDIAVITYKASQDITCNGKALPPNVWSADILVKEGDTWKSAYYNEVTIKEPKPEAKPEANKPANTAKPAAPEKPAANTAKPAAPPKVENTNKTGTYANANAAKSAESLADTLAAAERKGWEAWKNKDAAALQSLLAANFTYLGETGPTDKAAAIKMWTEHNCTIKSWSVTDPQAASLNPTVALLTFKGNASGSCDGTPLSNLWGTDLMIKEGDTWKSVFYMTSM